MMQQYHDLLQRILNDGDEINTERTGVGTIALFGEQLKFDMRKGFPAITTKKLAWKSVVSELIWFNRGSSNVNDLRAILHGEENRFSSKKTIWDDNYENQAKSLGYTNGEMGDIYGTQWRNFGGMKLHVEREDSKVFVEDDYEISGVDQIKEVLIEARKNPQSRRLIVSAWNPMVVWKTVDRKIGGVYRISKNEAALPSCHVLYQLNIVDDYIDLQWYQRSVDAFLGLPFNIASYALQLHKFARILEKTPRYLVGALGNVHIYKNHVEQVKEQLTREHLSTPMLVINPSLHTLEDFENSEVDDFRLNGLVTHGPIKAKMAI